LSGKVLTHQGVELRQGGVAVDEESTPNERTDLAQGDTQLIETGRFQWLAHGWSVAQYAVSLKLSPRNLALSYINTLMIQQVLAEPTWQGRLTITDLRALTPLKWLHVNPYGTFTLHMHERLPLAHGV